jgi:hypothetical protein
MAREYVGPDTWKYEGKLVVGTLLTTRDGSRIGNAIVTEARGGKYSIVTDFGNELKDLSWNGINTSFHEPTMVTTIARWNSDCLSKHARINCES